MVRGGVYYLDETLVLDALDSGTREYPITYTAYPGEQPILSGGVRLTGWAGFQGEILQTNLPAGSWSVSKSRILTFNGEIQRRGRWPNFDGRKNPISGGWAHIADAASRNNHTAFRYKGAFPRRWKQADLAEVNVMACYHWCNNIVPVLSVTRNAGENNRTVTLTREIWRSGSDNFERYRNMPFKPGNLFVMQNLLEELDQPGEWCLDPNLEMVYFWPPKAITKATPVVIPRLDCLVRLQNASHVRLSGFTFTETTSGNNYHRFGLEGYGAMFPIKEWEYCGESVHLKNSSHCAIENSEFHALGGNAVYLEGDCRKNTIRRNQFRFVGANGVCMLGTRDRHPVANEVDLPPVTVPVVKLLFAVTLGLSHQNRVAHNNIADLPHHAINLATNSFGRNIIEYNDIRRVCLVLHDNAAINAWMDEFQVNPDGSLQIISDLPRVGHVLRYNVLVDAASWAFYLDDWTSGCEVYGNIIVRPRIGGILVHGGGRNVLDNNVFIDCFEAIHYSNGCSHRPGACDPYKDNRMRNNIIYTTDNANADVDEAYLVVPDKSAVGFAVVNWVAFLRRSPEELARSGDRFRTKSRLENAA